MKLRVLEPIVASVLIFGAVASATAATETGDLVPLPRQRPETVAAPLPEPEKTEAKTVETKPAEAGVPLPREKPRLAAAEPEAEAPQPRQKPAAAEPAEAPAVPVPAAKPEAAPEAESPEVEVPVPAEKPTDSAEKPTTGDANGSGEGKDEPAAAVDGEAVDAAPAPQPLAPPQPVRIGPPPGPPVFADDAMSPACAAIEEGRVSGRPLKPVEDLSGCLVRAIYAVSSVGSERAVELKPEAELNCAMVDRLDTFVEEVVEPAAKEILESDLVGLRIAGSYVCRPRNGQDGAKQSEHGFANAVDVSAFVLADGRTISVVDGWADEGAGGEFLRAVHEKACGPFTTVIGPDGDEYHRDHFHLDLQPRGKGGQTTFCQ